MNSAATDENEFQGKDLIMDKIWVGFMVEDIFIN